VNFYLAKLAELLTFAVTNHHHHHHFHFLPCDTMLAWYMLLSCVSIRLSVTNQCSTKTAQHRITQWIPHDSPGTLVFWCQRSQQISNGSLGCHALPYLLFPQQLTSASGWWSHWLSVSDHSLLTLSTRLTIDFGAWQDSNSSALRFNTLLQCKSVLDAQTQNGDEPVGEIISFPGQSCLSSANSCWNG